PVPDSKVLLIHPRAESLFLDLLEEVRPAPYVPEPGAPAVSPSAVLGSGCCVAPGTHIGPDTVLGDNVKVYPGVFIGAGVTVGSDTVIYPNCVIYDRCAIGSGCILHAGCVIGADGFGYLSGDSGIRKYPHIGTVRIGSRVDIGANTTIDRAKLGETLVEDFCKIDNLCQIAHNVKTGKGCLICAQTGIAGSSTLGDYCVLAGSVGIADHIHLGSRVVVAAMSGVTKDYGDGEVISGRPARPVALRNKIDVLSLKLPEMYQTLRKIEKELGKLCQ
ncbi:MAG: UDP-3-O-(3-hydroxymyristoyl)glucosamine N-acyltransferase, partial [Abditibacteriota bacterium]|nr:UDP-3-O-(3-hydroxymyristoyl)glucosamine N-acyltransferase [Abditibacteriota bacterium]